MEISHNAILKTATIPIMAEETSITTRTIRHLNKETNETEMGEEDIINQQLKIKCKQQSLTANFEINVDIE